MLAAGWRLALPLLLCACATLAHAQSAPAGADDAAADPPDRVARLSYLAGDVALLPAGAQDWNDAVLNRPLTGGDKLSTTPGARAELELDGGALRLAGGTDLGLLDLGDHLAQVELTRGALSLSVRSLDPGESYEIDTPTVALVVDRPGTFRVDVDRDSGATTVGVLAGNATVYGENDAQRDIVAGRSYRFDDSALARVTVEDLAGGDEFDQWSADRDRRYAAATATRYVDEDVVGYQDLDQYGSWQADDEYGEVWYPAVTAADWAPYRYGHWAWIGPWGWTWVDDLPWGFAPYHYGRWVYRPRGWCWIPGPRGVRPVYAPALVAFVGGGRWSASAGIRHGAPVGWFPLGPGEIYNPWYRASHGYYARVNASNLRWRGNERAREMARIDEHYRYYRAGAVPPNARYANRQAPRGFTAVAGQHFADAQRVQRHLLPVDGRQLGVAPVLARGNGLPPTRAGNPAARGPGRPPAADFRREVVARHDPASRIAAAGHAPAGAVRAERPTNVRLLGDHRAPPSPAAAAPRATAATPRPPDMRAPAAAPSFRGEPSTPRPGELPSAHFAHRPPFEHDRAPATQPAAPRPDATPRAAPDRTLPQPPRLQRLPPAEARPRERAGGSPATLPTPPRFERPAPARETAPREFRSPPGPRLERAPSSERAAPRSESRGFAPPREAPRPMPSYRPPEPHAAPAAREHGGGNGDHPHATAAPHGRNDDHRHP
ncbi:hypothetical protein BV497_05900 [Fulvimonas soli]|nr:hypothetical protein BV497_05900 [Fulvimonas soli]